MFSKSRINEPGPKTGGDADRPKAPEDKPKSTMDFTPTTPKTKPAASVLSSDLTITGNLKTSGDIQIEGTVEGDIRIVDMPVYPTATTEGSPLKEAAE